MRVCFADLVLVQMAIFHRYLLPDNRPEAKRVRASGYVKGGQAHTLAGGKRVNAYPGPHDPVRDHYEFSSDVAPKLSLAFSLTGETRVREVYWSEGWPGVIDFPDEDKVGIAANVTKDPTE